MTDDERHTKFTKIVEEAMRDLDLIGDDEIITGWVLNFETIRAGGEPCAGHVYGPPNMTAWRAIGLLEWGRATIINPTDAT